MHPRRILLGQSGPTAYMKWPYDVSRATAIVHTVYTSIAWWGLTNADDRDNTEALLVRIRRRGFLSSSVSTSKEMVGEQDERLY